VPQAIEIGKNPNVLLVEEIPDVNDIIVNDIEALFELLSFEVSACAKPIPVPWCIAHWLIRALKGKINVLFRPTLPRN
jgi:hypothetical protein